MKSKLLIGIITTDCHTEYQSEIMRGMISQAFKSVCDVAVICPLNNFFIETTHKLNERSIFSLILSDAFSGFLYDRNSFQNENVKNYIDNLCTRSGKPVMLLDYNDHSRFETTMADDIDAFELMTDHLIRVHGCSRIYCLTGTKGLLCAEERLKGYLRSMKKHGLPIDKSYYSYGDFWTNSAVELARKILSGKLEKPDAVVCGNDIMAAALSDTLIKGGLKVPEDIAVTGYDASMEGYRANPSITSCQRPNFQLGAESFRRLYRIITGKICSKVPDEPGELRIGRSCGCMEDLELKCEVHRKLRTAERFQNKLFCSDMPIDITNTSDLGSLIDRIDHYTYLIYKMNQMFICVTENFDRTLSGNSSEKLVFSADTFLRIAFDKSAIQRNCTDDTYRSASDILDSIRMNKKQPSAFYISPLHYNENIFGFSAISFGKNPITYSRLYVQWINYLNIALEQVRIKSFMNTVSKRSDLSSACVEPAESAGRSFMDDFGRAAARFVNSGQTLTYIQLELTELKDYYYRNGHAKTTELLRLFSRMLNKALYPGENCRTIVPGCFGILVYEANRTNEIFSSLKSELSSFSGESCVSFTMGACSFEASADINISDIIHKAAVNIIHTFSSKETGVNPQLQKLIQLRSSMMKNPERSWNIGEISDSMFISKSYLQKIYKMHFNKSIIEELIQFRLDKAKKLLTDTELTVSEIAKECGYSTYNYFVRQFKAEEKLSPSDFREKYRKLHELNE